MLNTKLIKVILIISLSIITPFCFSQDYAFKCCQENNSHKKTCKNFNKLQDWEIMLDSVIIIQGQERIKSNFIGIARIKINRKDNTFSLVITNQKSKKPYIQLLHNYKESYWSTDCDGNTFPEMSISLYDANNEVKFGGFFWSETNCINPDFYLQYPSISYEYYGKVKVIDK